MPDDHSLTLKQANQARCRNELEIIRDQLAKLPTRKELARLILLATLTTAALVLVGIEALLR